MDLVSSVNSLSLQNVPTVNVFAAILGENHTEFVLTYFSNYINFIVTQFEKIGNIYQIKIDQPENGFNISEPVYTITTLLGAENLEAEVAARYLTDKLKIRKPFLLCLSLKDYSRDTLNSIAKAIQNYRKQ